MARPFMVCREAMWHGMRPPLPGAAGKAVEFKDESYRAHDPPLHVGHNNIYHRQGQRMTPPSAGLRGDEQPLPEPRVVQEPRAMQGFFAPPKKAYPGSQPPEFFLGEALPQVMTKDTNES